MVAEKNKKAKNEVPESKIKLVKETAKLIESKNTLMLASIKGLPAKNFQQIKKSLSEEAEIKILKKRALIRAIEASKKDKIKEIIKYVKEDLAVIISNTDPFDLSEKLSKNKSPIKAKVGQISNKDIEVEAGPTDIPAGPAVSELGSLGLTVQIKSGKIEIMQSKVIVQKGKEINGAAVSVMSKLSIMPFSVGFVPIVAYDSKSNSVLKEIEINKESTINSLKEIFTKSKSLALNIGYICKETIPILIIKAASHEKVILSIFTKENLEGEKNE